MRWPPLKEILPLFYTCDLETLVRLDSATGAERATWRIRLDKVPGRLVVEPPVGHELQGRKSTLQAPAAGTNIFKTQRLLLAAAEAGRARTQLIMWGTVAASCLLALPWVFIVMVPRTWYFLLDRLREISKAIQGREG